MHYHYSTDCFYMASSQALTGNAICTTNMHSRSMLIVCLFFQVINLFGNRIYFISENAFRNQTKLKSLNLNSNRIHHIPKLDTQLDTIESLSLCCNRIEVIGDGYFTRFPNIRHLDIGRNPWRGTISKQFVNGLSDLITLGLGGLGIASIDCEVFLQFNILRELYLDNNQLTEIPCCITNSSTPTLKVLFIGNNPITYINGTWHQSFSALEWINIEVTKITSLDFLSSMPRMKRIEAQGNPGIILTSNTFSVAADVQWFGASNSSQLTFPLLGPIKSLVIELDWELNKISCVDIDHISGMATLKMLNLTSNLLRRFPDVGCSGTPATTSMSDINFPRLFYAIIAENHLIEFPYLPNMPHGSIVDLSHNNMTTISINRLGLLERVLKLDIDNNELDEFPDFSGTIDPGLAYLRLDHNNMTVWSTENMSKLRNLTTLSMNHNWIVTIPHMDSAAATLKRLDLAHNFIEDIKPLILTSEFIWALENLNISYNVIDEIPVALMEQLVNLIYLNATNNALAVMPYLTGAGSNLSFVDLSYNQISSVPKENVLGLGRLKTLKLHFNFIREFPVTAIDVMPSLLYLNLSDNNLVTFSSLYHHIYQEKLVMDISRNAFQCTYKLCWLRTFNGFRIIKDTKLCDAPETMVNATFHTLSDYDLGCYCKRAINIIRPSQNGRHFPDDIFKCIFFLENV